MRAIDGQHHSATQHNVTQQGTETYSVEISLPLDQQGRSIVVAGVGGVVERRPVVLVTTIDINLILEQRLHLRDVVDRRSHMQRVVRHVSH